MLSIEAVAFCLPTVALQRVYICTSTQLRLERSRATLVFVEAAGQTDVGLDYPEVVGASAACTVQPGDRESGLVASSVLACLQCEWARRRGPYRSSIAKAMATTATVIPNSITR